LAHRFTNFEIVCRKMNTLPTTKTARFPQVFNDFAQSSQSLQTEKSTDSRVPSLASSERPASILAKPASPCFRPPPPPPLRQQQMAFQLFR
jgi:hypothetical protein